VPFDLTALAGVAVATVGGLAVGIEREWSGKAVGPRARFAGVRTFTLLGLVSGVAGWIWSAGLQGPAVVLLAGLCGLVVIAYLAASRADIDGTTEVAAFVVLTAGVLAGFGLDRVASGIIALTVLLLVEKRQLHGLVSKLDRIEIRAGARFAVMAAVVLPLLPAGPYGPWGGVRPRMLWALVLFFSGLSFAGYVARRAIGKNRGYAVAGTIGGLVSSTSVTLALARVSRNKGAAGLALAAGTLGASVMLFPRVLLAMAVLAPAVARALWPACILPMAIGSVLVLRGAGAEAHPDRFHGESNPLQVAAALQMAILFQFVLFGVWAALAYFGEQGLFSSAAVLGLADVDALTVSLAQASKAGTAPEIAARALMIGILANTCVKFGIAMTVGRGRFRPLAMVGLALMGLALGAGLIWK
jgi:uncharacterized membrane protein (DUF4010 family)